MNSTGSSRARGQHGGAAPSVKVTIHAGERLLHGLKCGGRTLIDARTYNVTGEGEGGGQGWALLIAHGPKGQRLLTTLRVDEAWRIVGWDPPSSCQDIKLPNENDERRAVQQLLTGMGLTLHWI